MAVPEGSQIRKVAIRPTGFILGGRQEKASGGPAHSASIRLRCYPLRIPPPAAARVTTGIDNPAPSCILIADALPPWCLPLPEKPFFGSGGHQECGAGRRVVRAGT